MSRNRRRTYEAERLIDRAKYPRPSKSFLDALSLWLLVAACLILWLVIVWAVTR